MIIDPYINVIFNLEKNTEIVTYKKMYKKGKQYTSQYLFSPKEKSIGTFLIDFLNTDMHKRENVENFITEYCFEQYYYLITKKQKEKYVDYVFTISEEEYKEALNEIYKKYNEDFIWAYETFWDIAMKKYRYTYLYENYKYKDPKLSKNSKKKLDSLVPNDYFEDLDDDDLKESIGDIIIDFNFLNYYGKKFPSNITCSYKSRSYVSILYLMFRQIASSKFLICKCENCGKFFIPLSNHDTKYCNNIFKNNKTCKSLAPELVYKQKLQQDPLLKKYRARYQSLQKAAALNPDNNSKKYEDYKKIGAIKKNDYLIGNLSADEFEKWIESTKLKK